MNITDVRVRKVAKEGKMKAVVSITIDDEFVVLVGTGLEICFFGSGFLTGSLAV